jgi:hypothetical protein
MFNTIMNIVQSPWTWFAVLVVANAIAFFVKYKQQAKKTFLQYAKQQLLQLFLQAEKRDDLQAQAKMDWCIQQLYKLIVPAQLTALIPEKTIEEWANNQYQEFKKWLTDYAIANEDSAPATKA